MQNWLTFQIYWNVYFNMSVFQKVNKSYMAFRKIKHYGWQNKGITGWDKVLFGSKERVNFLSISTR